MKSLVEDCELVVILVGPPVTARLSPDLMSGSVPDDPSIVRLGVRYCPPSSSVAGSVYLSLNIVSTYPPVFRSSSEPLHDLLVTSSTTVKVTPPRLKSRVYVVGHSPT